MRLFLAIELSPDVRQHLVSVQRALRAVANIAYTKAENLHLTLKFLGEVPEPAVPALCDSLKDIPHVGAFNLTPDRLACFPERGPVRIVAAEAEPVPAALVALVDHIEVACRPHGFAPEPRRFRAHITLARARNPLPGALRARLAEATQSLWPAPSMPVSRFILMQSQLDQRGPAYAVAASFDIILL